MKTECGVLGIWSPEKKKVSSISPLLMNLQHRGQDSCGIGWYNEEDRKVEVKHALGKVENLIRIENNEKAQLFIGHTRYTTSSKGKSLLNSAHPIKGIYRDSEYAFVFNGNIPKTENDTEFIINFLKKCEDKYNFKEAITKFMKTVDRAYNIIFIYQNQLLVIRDPYGTRPIHICVVPDGTILISSETCVFDSFNKEYDCFTTEIKPGNITLIHDGYIRNEEVLKLSNTAFCLFEYIYFMKDNSASNIPGKSVGEMRNLFGVELARQEKTDAVVNDNIILTPSNTVVSGIPNTANDYARGYATEMGYPYLQVIQKVSNSMRTFIEPSKEERTEASNKKYNYLESEIKGKNVILVDDSIVRGITIENIARKIRTFNPLSIHIRVGCPPIINTCNLGVDMSKKEELIKNCHLDIESIRETIGVDSLIYLKLENINEVVNLSNFCSGCMNGNFNGCPDANFPKHLDW